MEKQEILHLVKEHLPLLLAENQELIRWIEQLTASHYAKRQQTESRFDMLLEELRQDREEQARKWAEEKAENALKWEENNRKWEDNNRKWEDNNRKWDENNRKWDESKAESDRKWEESKAESDRKWEESGKRFDAMHHEIMELSKKQERSIGALGARWGTYSEKAFRDALAGILVESFGVEVVNYTDFDEDGDVFGRPEQVELDVLIRNGTVILVEMKSSIDKAGMYIFERKVRFYEKIHKCTVERMIVISPMIDHRAAPVAKKLGIETYGDSMFVPAEL